MSRAYVLLISMKIKKIGFLLKGISMVVAKFNLKKIIFFGFVIICSMNDLAAMTKTDQTGDTKEVSVKTEPDAGFDASDNKKDDVQKVKKDNPLATLVEQTLLEGVDVNTLYTEKALLKTVLHTAAKEGNRHVVTMLLTAGMRVWAEDSLHRSALYYAVEKGHSDIAIDVLDAEAKSVDVIPVLAQKYEGRKTIVHMAAAKGMHKIVRKVCEKLGERAGPLVAQKDDSQATAFDLAYEQFLLNRADAEKCAPYLLTIEVLIEYEDPEIEEHEKHAEVLKKIRACKNDGTLDTTKVEQESFFGE